MQRLGASSKGISDCWVFSTSQDPGRALACDTVSYVDIQHRTRTGPNPPGPKARRAAASTRDRDGGTLRTLERSLAIHTISLDRVKVTGWADQPLMLVPFPKSTATSLAFVLIGEASSSWFRTPSRRHGELETTSSQLIPKAPGPGSLSCTKSSDPMPLVKSACLSTRSFRSFAEEPGVETSGQGVHLACCCVTRRSSTRRISLYPSSLLSSGLAV